MTGDSTSRAEARLRAGLLHGHDITQLTAPSVLIEGILPLDSTAVLFGPSGSGKSLIALDWALHVASGRSWWGRGTHHGEVLYVVAEGARGTKYRYESWCAYHNVTQVNNIHWLTIPANVILPAERDALLRIVAELHPCFTVLDTIARHMPGGDENAFETMSLIVETLDAIKRESEGTSLGVHHAGKDEEKGSRGHSSLKGALDAELSVKTSRKDGQMAVQVYAEKYKDWEDHKVLYTAKMEKVGESLVPVVDGGPHLRPAERTALECLNGQYRQFSDWYRASGLSHGTFGRAQSRLRELGLIEGDSTLGWRRI